MAHRVGHRDVQRLAIEREIERVVADLAGRLEPSGQRELVRLAGEGCGKQPALNLGRERQWDGALAPLEEIGVAPVGDHHVAELMGGQLDVLERGRLRLERQDELEHADRLAPARHGRDDAGVIPLQQHDGVLPGEEPSSPTRSAVSALREPGSPSAAMWPSRFNDRPLKSAIRKLTSRAPIASSNAAASTSTAATGGAASTAASSAFRFSGSRAA